MFRLSSTIKRSLSVGMIGAFLVPKAAHQNATAFQVPRFYATCDGSNPLANRNGLPLFDEIKVEHVMPALEVDIKQLQFNFKDFEGRLASAPHDFNLFYDMEKIKYNLETSWSIVSHLNAVKNSPELRTAHQTMQPKVVELLQSLGQSKPVYDSLVDMKEDQQAWSTMNEAQQRIVSSSLLSMSNSGVGLTGLFKDVFNKNALELADLSTKFNNNVLDSTKAFKLVITDKAQIEGLPKSALGLASQQAVAAGHTDSTPENGPWLITLDMPSYLPAMQNIKSREIRENLYRAFVTRASSGEHDNSQIIKRILQLKREQSRALGYETHAEKSLSTKMAPNVEKVMELIEMLRSCSYDAAKQDIEDLKSFAKAQGCEYADRLDLWDIPYWSERLRENKYEYSDEEIRPYFALNVVLKSLFDLSTRLFGITIEEADGQAQVWHSDVKFFNIRDAKTKEYIASFYLDPYSRPAEKRGGAWMDVCVQRSDFMGKKPVAYLVCNSSPPVGDTPALLSFREVETLFHEFGHGLQHMLTTVPYHGAAGIHNVEWDAVELPSQFMENWCYDRPTLFGMAKHYQTGEVLPEELYQKLVASKQFQAGLFMLRQLYFGALDMNLHATYDPYGKKSPFELQRELYDKFTVVRPLDEDRFLCSFSHIFGGGYSAGYYSYKWAEVMSADAFAAFEEVGLNNEEAVRKTGHLFRDTVLSMGGGKHPGAVFRAFRGRDPSPEALLRHSGLSTTAEKK